MPPASPAPGLVSLVGAGPGDPGLLTVAGRRALERADVVLYDHLTSPALLASVPVPGQERIHVGKRAEASRLSEDHEGGVAAQKAGFVTQDEINALITRRARAGQRVVRLKGGDPFTFGRGGEEAQVCVSAGLPFEVIPGVSAVSGALTTAGIPISHRAISSAFTVVTGHERSDQGGASVDWARLGRTQGTLVVLMGVLQVRRWTEGLLAGGMSPDTPVAFVRWGTTPLQHTLTATLGTIAAEADRTGLRPPATAVVGEVVSLREQLAWLEARPLFGEVIALTRSRRGDAAEFEALEDLGAAVVHVPLTEQVPVDGGAPLVDALRAGGFTDLVLTSANGARALASALTAANMDARDLAGVHTWAVGPATARAMRSFVGIAADEVPAEPSADGLVAHAAALGVEGRAFLFPAAAAARRVVPEGLVCHGASLTEVAAYETRPLASGPADLQSAVDAGLSCVALASPSAVLALINAMDTIGVQRDAVAVAAIGPTTAAAARQAGLTVRVEAENHTMSGLATAIAESAKEE